MKETGSDGDEELVTTGALALSPRAVQGVPAISLRKGGRAALRIVGDEPTEAETADRLARLEDFGNPAEFAEEGSVSYQLMQQLWSLDPDRARERLQEIFAKVAAPLHLRPVVAALTHAIEDRRLEGMPWKEITDGIKLEIPLEGYAITVADINGYTACLLKGEYHEKVEAATAIVHTFNEVAKATGAVLLEPVEGDAGMFLTFSAEQQSRLEAELKQRKIPMKVKKLERERHVDGTDKYPVDPVTGERVFTESVGVHKLQEGPDELKMAVYTGKRSAKGAVVVRGKARDAAVAYQKKAGPGATLKEELQGADVQNPKWNKDPELPEALSVAVKMIEAILKISPYSPAAFQELLSLASAAAPDVMSSKMNAYYLALELNPSDENEAKKIDGFWRLLTEEGTGDARICLFKPAGSRGMHFWTQGIATPEDFTQAFTAFNQRITHFAQQFGLNFRLSLGYEDALELIKLPGSFQVDATGPSIVATVRGISALEGKGDGNWMSVDRSVVTAMGLVDAEMSTIYIKGTAYQVVQVRLGADGKWEVRESLLGRDKQEAEINTFVESLGLNGVALRLHKPANAKESGYGESALVRAAERCAASKRIDVIQLKNTGRLFDELEEFLGHSVDDLIRDPQLLRGQVLLTLDEDSFSPDLAARLDRFLFAMAGTPLGIVYTGAYQFRPEALMGDAYSGRELSKDVEVGELSQTDALDLVFKARPDLEPQDRPLIAQLLTEWGNPLVPRALIRNFSKALLKQGDRWDLAPALLNQAHAGVLDYALEAAGLNETDRTVLGVIAEVGYGVPLEFINGVLGFDCTETLNRLLGEEHPFLVLENACYSIRESTTRQARLLARKYQPAIHAQLQKQDFLREDPVVNDLTVDRSMLELEHALAHSESCKSVRTLLLMDRLGHYYLKEKNNFGAAYGLYSRFLEACEGHELGLGGMPDTLLHDLVWTLLETSHVTDTKRAQTLLAAHPAVATPELMWRGGMRLRHLLPADEIETPPEDYVYANVVAQMTEAFTKMDGAGIKLHPKLIKDLKLGHVFSDKVREATEAHPGEEILPLAFSGAALSRLACASRQLDRLAKIVATKLPDETDLAQSLQEAATYSRVDTLSRLGSLQANLTLLEAETPLDQELKAEILRCLLDAYKYLNPSPNDEDMSRIQQYYGRTDRVFQKLPRPVQSAALDAFDVYANAAVFHWEKKLPLPAVFAGEDEANASTEGKEKIWMNLSEYEGKVRVQLSHTVRNALMPYRLRLTHQLMNFLQMKMRLLARNVQPNEKALFEELLTEYKSLAEDSSRITFLLSGDTQPDYFASECLPIKKAVDRMSAA